MTYFVNVKVINDGIKTSVQIIEQCNNLQINSNVNQVKNKNSVYFNINQYVFLC